MTLTDIPVGKEVTISYLKESHIRICLIERGFLSDSKITKIHSISKKGPFIFSIGGSKFCLRKDESDLIIIK